MFPAFVRRFWLRASRAGAAAGATALSTLAPLQARWQRLSTRHQHWGINILIGLCIETLVHIAGHNLHWPAVVAAQDRGLDTMTRLHAWACEDPSPGGSPLQRLLHCPDTQPGRPAPNNPLRDDPAWGAAYFWRDGAPVADMAAACPATMAALELAPMPRIPGRAPTALWSRLLPGAHIVPHHGLLNTRLICHIPIRTVPGCTLRVGGETRSWDAGVPLVFDDSIEHEARNQGNEARVVLLFEVWRPEINEEDREAIGRLFQAIDSFGL